MSGIYKQRAEDLGWVETSIKDIKRGDVFRFDLPDDGDPSTDDNPLGDDLFTAASDAYQEGNAWAVAIVKPDQIRWTTRYLNLLADRGATIQVKGKGVNSSLEYRTISG